LRILKRLCAERSIDAPRPLWASPFGIPAGSSLAKNLFRRLAMVASMDVASPSDPLLSWTAQGDRLRAVASGPWTSANADRLERLTDSLSRQPAASITLDIAGVGELDTIGG
jgi:hypothetical protein